MLALHWIIALSWAGPAIADHGGIVARLNPVANIVQAAGAGGQAYRFNPELAIFEPTKNQLGPLLAHGAPTVGKGRLYVNSTYTHFSFDTLEDFGKTADGDGSDKIPEFTLGFLDFVGQFGITERWQATLSVPFVFVDCTECINKGGGFGNIDNDGGIGDIRLRTKYHVLDAESWRPDIAILGEISTPSGRESRFRGTGFVHFTGMLIASATYGDWFSPHMNLDVQLATADDHASEQHNLKWVLGTDFHPLDWLNLSLDFFGRHRLDASKDRELGTVVGENTFDVGIGTKVNPWRTLNLTAAVIIPLNKDIGFRTIATWRLGAEYVF